MKSQPIFLSRDSSTLTVVRTQSWRRSKAGYQNGCTENDVLNEISTAVRAGQNSTLTDFCELQNHDSSETCENLESSYIVTDIEDKQSPLNNYCYGYGNDVLPKPVGPFLVKIESCCWVNFMNDFGKIIGSASQKRERNDLKLIAKINDLEKVFKLGIQQHSISKSASDLANYVRLSAPNFEFESGRHRWRPHFLSLGDKRRSEIRKLEAQQNILNKFYSIFHAFFLNLKFAEPRQIHDFEAFASLTLEKCSVVYDGTKDQAKTGYKPIAVMVEDVDENGAIRSSVPVQFLAEVWSPQPTKNTFGRKGRVNTQVYKYPDPYAGVLDYEDGDGDSDDDYFEIENARKRRETDATRTLSEGSPAKSGEIPGYCDAKPVLVFPSPEAGSTIVFNKNVEIELKAESRNGAIKRFLYNKPRGMECTSVTKEGTVTCSWTPQKSQNGIFNFCFWADDIRGLTSERRCVSLRSEISDIFSMIEFFFASSSKGDKNVFSVDSFRDYGCAGNGNMKFAAPTRGMPVDQIDAKINNWKQCKKCALEGKTRVAYEFDELEFECSDEFGTQAHSLCSCDLDFVKNIEIISEKYDPNFLNFDQSKCAPFPPAFRTTAKGACCKSPKGVFGWYNKEIRECCENGQIREIGEC
ncbi:unnamed protein product [Oikopleura dioica]|uniref:Uncharacterized protein n=1 Tax=Oikopleura dioica TaxID=34765 RepID=E4XJL2_OIKDI|nr:unnamed protein product [Oikopleura dioica]